MKKKLLNGLLMSVALMTTVACTMPVTQSRTALTWPRSDEALSTSQKVEIERLLSRLGYMRGGVDGAITRNTRVAIQTYQRDVGAPVSGYVSRALLTSLRSTAGVSGAQPAAAPAPRAAAPKAAAPKAAAPTPAATAAPKPVFNRDEDDNDDSGGGGGDDGGGWG